MMGTIDPRLIELVDTLVAAGADWLAFEILDGIRSGKPGEESDNRDREVHRSLRSWKDDKSSEPETRKEEAVVKPMEGDDQIEFAASYVVDRITEAIEMTSMSLGIADDLFPKLVEHDRKIPFIKDQLPTIFHAPGHTQGEIEGVVLDTFSAYRETLPDSIQSLLDRYQLRDAAIKVVGVGSVGTRCWVLLFMAGDGDPLFLQFKEARRSVLEAYAGASVFPNHGQRVISGYRLIQPASDMFLGWTESKLAGRHYFIRQLRDIKISIRVETFGARETDLYATWCGRALALAHARSGSASTLSGYMGAGTIFDEALANFSVAYADQNERDHAALQKAVRNGKVKAVLEE